ncbi:hypothetical protein NSK_002797 [Nannochloropsis salina CCMP1776]|uniref:Autophagy-related protein 11 C-terminal domain-containing protein n=1 Tax=Nannochloropsis salina CCMP1776 TaxID=1027361 RepID=A0A4D9D6G9_9STRA|nr:hypothetical protein NSK_002797 [Nannochloropsis salina CCMP1776]|eukprot:TFJ85977.1 hypothetical protein NSK_002797 [Nannochloropsis salina CCMP1776]
MSWGRSPPQNFGALGRSPFKSSSPRPLGPGEDSGHGPAGGSSSREDARGEGGSAHGTDWTLLDQRCTRGPASCSPSSSSASREFLSMAEHRRRSMSLDIPRGQHHRSSQAPKTSQQLLQPQHSNYHGHHRSSTITHSSSPGNILSLAREFSGLSAGMRGTPPPAPGHPMHTDRSSSGVGSSLGMMEGSGSGSGSTGGSVGGSGSGVARSHAASSSPSTSVASTSDTATVTGVAGTSTSEPHLQRQFRARLDEAEQQAAYWQARAKEAEHASGKSQRECISLRSQLSAQQGTAVSRGEVLASMYARVERIMVGLGMDVAALPAVASKEAIGGCASTGAEGKEGGAGGGTRAQTSVLESIELGLMALEKQLLPLGKRTQKVGDLGGRDAAPALPPPSPSPSSPSSPPSFVIHFQRFALGHVALFFPTPAGDYLAFNVGCPHYYLSEDAKAWIGRDRHFRKYYVLGRITRLVKCQVPTVEEEEGRVGEGEGEGKATPFSLAPGTRYAVVSVEPIKGLSESVSLGSAGSSSDTKANRAGVSSKEKS